jgi:hypothetical protein
MIYLSETMVDDGGKPLAHGIVKGGFPFIHPSMISSKGLVIFLPEKGLHDAFFCVDNFPKNACNDDAP